MPCPCMQPRSKGACRSTGTCLVSALNMADPDLADDAWPPVGRLHIHQSEIRDLAIIGFGDRGATAHVRTALGLDRHSTVCIVFDLDRRVRKSPSILSRPTTIGSGSTWKGRQCRRSMSDLHLDMQYASGHRPPMTGAQIHWRAPGLRRAGIQDNSESPHRDESGPQSQTAQRLRRSGTTCDTYNPHNVQRQIPAAGTSTADGHRNLQGPVQSRHRPQAYPEDPQTR